MRPDRSLLAFTLALVAPLWPAIALAAPPAPSGPHPRLFMSAADVSAYKASAASPKTAAAGLVAQCQDTLDNPGNYSGRGGSDGNYWPQSAVSCAFAYVATQNASYLTQAITYWRASLDDDQTVGDGKGCVAGVATDWQSWLSGGQNGAAPPILLTITHDTGYPIRWYGPDIALAYDWLNSAPGVDAALLAQTRTCLTAWNDYYTQVGYHHDEAGANYNAGYVVSKALGAVAIGTDGGADGHLFTQVIDDDVGALLVQKGLLGAGGKVGTPAGVMLGGDWAEGWQYGPLSVVEYAAATRALEDQGAALPAMDAWASSLVLRSIYAATPTRAFEFCGEGDCDVTTPNTAPRADELDAVLLGPSSDQAAGWAASLKQKESLGAGGYVYDAIAEARAVTPQDYTAQSPAPPLWYLARGTRAMYVRTAWDASAFWAVFTSPPQLSSDHQHFAASNFVLSRGADDLVVDPTPYGSSTSWESNAVTAESAVVQGDYSPSQTPWSEAELPWARGTSDATFAARSDFAKAFIFDGTPSDVPYAHREWVLLPEGEAVAIDRVHTAGAAMSAYVTFHTNTAGTLKLSGGVAQGTSGGSQVAIHAVLLSGGAPAITQPSTSDCSLSCNYPCASCDTARFAVDAYRVKVPGPWAVAVHVIDALAASEAAATVGSMNDDTVDPAPKQNAGVLGAAVLRASKQSYVVASSAQDGAGGATMTYGVPGASASRHVVYDAPEASDGTSSVVAAVKAGRCVLTVTAGSGGGFAGHPLMFQVGPASGGCVVTDDTNVPPGNPGGGGGDAGTGGGDGGVSSGGDAGGPGGTSGDGGAGLGDTGGGAGGSGGCGCREAGAGGDDAVAFGLAAAALAVVAGRRRRRRLQ
ncbi:MAG TPA: hypothetical protein VIF15_08825 [Polyangiaceae bacterium]